MINNSQPSQNLDSTLKAEDFVIVKGINNSDILGQVSIDGSCIYLSLTDVELSRILIHPKLVMNRFGSMSEIIKLYPNSFFSITSSLHKPKNDAVLKYQTDSLFPMKALYRLINNCLANGTIENKADIEKYLDTSINEAIQEEILISDMNYMLSQYIFNRPRAEMEI